MDTKGNTIFQKAHSIFSTKILAVESKEQISTPQNTHHCVAMDAFWA